MTEDALFNDLSDTGILSKCGLINTSNDANYNSYTASALKALYDETKTTMAAHQDMDPRAAVSMAAVAMSHPAAVSADGTTVAWADFLKGKVETSGGTNSVSVPSGLDQILNSINLISGVSVSEDFDTMWASLALAGVCDPDPATSSVWNLDKFTLGYDKITMKEVIQWAYSQLKSDPSVPVTFTAGGTYTFAVVNNADGSSSIKVTIVGPANDTSSASIEYTNASGQNMLANGSGPTAMPDTFDNWVAAIGKTFCKALSSMTASIRLYRGTTVIDPTTGKETTTYVTGLTGHYTESSTTYVDPKTKVSTPDPTPTQNRLEQNAVLQQYVAQIRAKRSVVQNASAIIQSTLQTAQSSINKIASLWTSILQAISTILHSLYHSSS